MAIEGQTDIGVTDGYTVKLVREEGSCTRVVVERSYTIGNDFSFRSKTLTDDLNGKQITITASTPIQYDGNKLVTFEWSAFLQGVPAAFGLTLSEALYGLSERKGNFEFPKYENVAKLVEENCKLRCISEYGEHKTP